MIHLHLQECESTQEEVLKRISKRHDEQILISTERQSLGRGRRGNQWIFYPGSLAFSFTLEAPSPIQLASLEIGLLFCRYVDEKIKLKWPNDLMFEGKKCGGILCQLAGDRVIVGMGLNIFQETARISSKNDNSGFGPGWLPWKEEGLQKNWPLRFYRFVLKSRLHSSSILAEFPQYCDHMGRSVSIHSGENEKGEGVIEGIFQGIGPNGEGVIASDPGKEPHRVLSGSLFYN
ncbi:MAG: biotin--[acetyl-CoA-carboxylase] ligase [Bacteriovoracales bacterium]|nr:biotin--[acetyl-CoA-carboxylase] ligase [Bacteriovoracales bacterium]